MNQKPSANQIFFTLLGIVVVAACVFLLVRALTSHNIIMPSPAVVLPAQNPYSFSTSSPLVITQTTAHIQRMGTVVTYTGTLPATGSCQSLNTQTTTYGTNPIRFAFIINTAPDTSCPNPKAPQTFTTGFSTDSKGNTPVLSAVFVNGTQAIYVVDNK